MEKTKRNIGRILIALVIILIGIIMLSYLENPVKTNIASKKEAMTTEEIQNIGRNGRISQAVIINRLTGTGPFDSDDTAGNDSTAENNIVRSFDQITWTIENTMQLKDETSQALKGGRIQIKAELPENMGNVVKWDLDSMKWAEDATISPNGTILTASYSLNENEVTIPGKQNLVVVLKVLGAANGTEIQPTFTVTLVGSGEEQTVQDSVVEVSAKPSYNVELKQNTELYKQIDLTENQTTGRVYGYFLGLQLHNGDNPDKGMKGIEFPKGNITFDIDLKMERTPNGENTPIDITSGATPTLYNYALNESTNTTGNIAGRPMNGLSSYSQYHINYPANNGNGVSDSVYNSGTIEMTQQGSKVKVTINNYELNVDGVFPKTRYKDVNITDNIGYFGAYYFQVLVPYTDATLDNNSSYYLTVSDNTSTFSATSIGNTSVTNQALVNDDLERYEFVRYPREQFALANWLKTGWNVGLSYPNGDILHTAYDQGDARAAVGQTFVVKTAVASNSANSLEATVYSANSLLKFDGEAFQISEIDGKEWNIENSCELLQSQEPCEMDFHMLYVAKTDGTNWSSDEEMKSAKESDLLYYTSLDALKSALGQNAKCVGVLWESLSGTMGPNSGYGLGLALKVTDKAQKGNVYQFVSRHCLYYDELDRTNQTRTNPNATFPNPNVKLPKQAEIEPVNYYTKSSYDENGDITSGSHSGGYSRGQSLLIISGEVTVEKTVADLSDGKSKENYDLGRNETEVTYKVKPMLKSLEGSTDRIEEITITLTDTLPKGLKYKKGSSNSTYGEPTVTENADGTSTLVWRKGTFSLDDDIPLLTYKAAIDLTSANGTAYTSSVIVEADKLVKTPTKERTSTATINIIKLASYSLYKNTETPLIEQNGEGSYNVVMLNMTTESVPNFQLLDILPYNGDTRETLYNGTYTVTKIELSGNVTGEPVSVDNLRIAVTEDESVRNGVTAKDANLGNDGIWQIVSNGANINKELTGFAVVGELQAGTQLIAKVYIKTKGNNGEDKYINSATAQTNTATAAIESPVATIQVINRTIEGKVWLDNNENGIIDTGDLYINGIPVTLLNEDGTVAKDINGNNIATIRTANGGYYKFEHLPKGKYIVRIEGYGTRYEITQKNVGNNEKINSKFNSNGKTDVLTKLNVDDVLTAKEQYINAGMIFKKPETIENTITKEAKANKTVDGEEVLTQEDGKVTYTINYNFSIKDYVGKAKVTLVDTLPAKIDVSRCNLEGGTYNEAANTITWEQIIEGINSYTSENQTYTNTIQKIIEIVYAGQDVNAELVNIVKGTTVTYYPDNDPTKPGKEKTTVEAETEEPIKQEYMVDKMVEKIWEDNNNSKGNRPEAIQAQLKGNGEVIATVRLSNSNKWKHVFNRLNKYTAQGEVIKYEITEKEINTDDLKYYSEARITVSGDKTTITNIYRETGKIIVEHKDIDTDENITYIDEDGNEKTYNYDDEDYVGEEYKTEPEEIPYYELVKIPDNKDGEYKKEDQTITYYYRKLPFNIGVEKTVKEIIVNGESKNVGNGKLSKIEIPESKMPTTEMIVKYKIVVKNTGKVDGIAEIVDTIPTGFDIAEDNPSYWTVLSGEKLATKLELKIGEEKELEVILKWKTSSQNLGTTKNVAEVTNTDNEPKYPDNNPDDNISFAEVIISVKTGREIISEILLISGISGLIMLLAITFVDVKISYRKKL